MSIRQEKFSKLLQKDLGEIFQQNSRSLFEGNFITVSTVTVTPDLGKAKVYLSFLNVKDPKHLLSIIELQSKEIRHELAQRIKNQVRKIPELEFFIDNSLDYVEHMEQIFKKLNEDKKD